MSSEGWNPIGPKENHARAPFTSLPMLGISTTTMRLNDTRSSIGTNRRQWWYGTRVVMTSAAAPRTVQSACLRKYVQLEPSTWSAVTDEADRTITRPSSVSTAITAPRRYASSGAGAGARRRAPPARAFGGAGRAVRGRVLGCRVRAAR